MKKTVLLILLLVSTSIYAQKDSLRRDSLQRPSITFMYNHYMWSGVKKENGFVANAKLPKKESSNIKTKNGWITYSVKAEKVKISINFMSKNFAFNFYF